MKKKNFLIFGLIIIVIAAIIVPTVVFNLNKTKSLNQISKNLSTYAIDAKFTSSNTIVATESIDYINSTGVSLKEICLHLYPRAFRQDAKIRPYTNLNKASCFPKGESFGDILIDKVNINGNSANFVFAGEDEDILQINLSDDLSYKSRIQIDIDFMLTIPTCVHRFGCYNGIINLANWYPIVCYYGANGFDLSPYYSTGDPFVSDCANYNVNIQYPAEYECFGTGEQTQNVEDKFKISNFSAIVVRDFALFLTNKASYETKNVDKTAITYVGYDGDNNISNNLEISAKAVQYFSKTFGKYPYSSLIVAKSSFLQGGMEYPNLVIISDSLVEQEELNKVIVHEIAHQWWYGVVGNNQVTEAFLDESLAEYSTCLFFEEHSEYGEEYGELIKDAIASYLIYVDVISSLNGKVHTAMNLRVNEYLTEYEYTYMIYVRGVIMFDSLREAVGRDKLIKALKKYYQKYSYAVANASDFIGVMKSVCHGDLDNFFAGWINGSNVVGYTN